MLFCGLAIMFLFGDWRIALLMLLTVPALVGAQLVQVRISNPDMQAARGVNVKAKVSAGAILGELVAGIRTVNSFGMQERITDIYAREVDAERDADARSVIFRGFTVGVSISLTFFAWGVLMYYGGFLMSIGAITQVTSLPCKSAWDRRFEVSPIESLFVPLMTLSFLSIPLALVSADASDAKACSDAAALLFNLIDRESFCDPSSLDGVFLADVRGDITVRDVQYAAGN